MKTPATSVLIFILSIPLVCSAQTKDNTIVTPLYTLTTFTSPEPAGFTPPSLGAAESADEVQANKISAGFEKVYFSTATINALLVNQNCIGIRFYNAMNEANNKVTVIAVGVKADGTELGSADPFYCISNGIGATTDVNHIQKTVAVTCATNLKNNPSYHYYTSYLSKSMLNSLTGLMGAVGIHVMPGNRMFTFSDGTVSSALTMQFCAAAASGRNTVDLGGANAVYRKSIEPCPPVCGTTSNYLVSPN